MTKLYTCPDPILLDMQGWSTMTYNTGSDRRRSDWTGNHIVITYLMTYILLDVQTVKSSQSKNTFLKPSWWVQITFFGLSLYHLKSTVQLNHSFNLYILAKKGLFYISTRSCCKLKYNTSNLPWVHYLVQHSDMEEKQYCKFIHTH